MRRLWDQVRRRGSGCSGVRTKSEAVELALRQLAGQPMTRDEALAMHGAHAILDPPPDSGPPGQA